MNSHQLTVDQLIGILDTSMAQAMLLLRMAHAHLLEQAFHFAFINALFESHFVTVAGLVPCKRRSSRGGT